jgi:hypothetical protein
MNLPKGKPTKREEQRLCGTRKTISIAVEIIELGMRAGKVGVKPWDVLGCKPWECPNATNITQEQMDKVRRAVEEQEQLRS